MTKTKTLSDKDFKVLTTQANVFLTLGEEKTIKSELTEALNAVTVLSDLDTSKVTKYSSASGLTNILRDDLISPSLTQEQALVNAKETHKGYFMTAGVFDSKDN